MKRLILLALVLIPLTVAALSRVSVEQAGSGRFQFFTVDVRHRDADSEAHGRSTGPRIRLALNLFGHQAAEAEAEAAHAADGLTTAVHQVLGEDESDAEDAHTEGVAVAAPPAPPAPPAIPRARGLAVPPVPPAPAAPALAVDDAVVIHEIPAPAPAEPLAVVTSPLVLQILINRDDVAGAAHGDLAQLQGRIAEAVTRATADARRQAADAQGSPVREQLLTSGKRSSEDRALADLQKRLEALVGDWLGDAGVPADWQPPATLVQALLRGRPEVELVERRDYADLYQAQVAVSLDPAPRARLVQAYRQEVAARRFSQLGAGLVFVLASLGLVAGYIHTDEATRGYYTNRLRVGVLAALGAGGAILYRVLA